MKKILLLTAGLIIFFHTIDAQSRPNVIYIYADDMGYGELGCYGQQKIKTPNLDRMAAEGMRFTQHYSGTPVCAPARCMLLTGKNGGHSYIRGNYELGGFPDSLEGGQMPLPEGSFTLGHLFRNAGYATAAIGKWGLGSVNTTGHPLLQGFDYFYGYLDQKQAHNYYPTHLWENQTWDTLNNPYIWVHRQLNPQTATDRDFDYFKGNVYSIDRMTEKALRFIRTHREQPFFLYLPYTIPHVSLQVPEKYINMYKGQFDEKPYYGQQGYAAARYPLSAYAGMITCLDDQVGLIMKEIKKLGLDQNTIILFSSDNGATFNGGVDAAFFNSVQGLRGLKMDIYEGGFREPFIARWPGKIPAGKTSALLSVQYDMMPTFAELTGQPLAHAVSGISLLPELLGKGNQQQHAYLYFEYPEKGGQVAVRIGPWKGIRTGVQKDRNAPWQLYNLETDLREVQDVAAQHPDVIRQMQAVAVKEHQHPHIKDWEFIDPKFEKASEALKH
ncbi:arylsulfatase [Niabella drilacis]|uniref:Arylsulfatase A n=1 Tax=Niabella drilacis (strain DSM 25811 / CCM 8410 / CCUG 62505 / LMG 26954 / E90) TaxID=1285928 RepID=A0A1G6IK75_NIADE|nr:arylsulfatase [Niabella drilacis]SDC06888.1 Arylsulfatase A [Niabella drilacis]